MLVYCAPLLFFSAGLVHVAQFGDQQAIELREQFVAGKVYHVSCRVQLAGSLRLPAEDAKTTNNKDLRIDGKSAIEYDERILAIDQAGTVNRTLRLYKELNFQRKVGNEDQQGQLRESVRRLAILRHKQVEVPFSPDGPLMWGELDLVRTDVFTPVLAGLLPDRPAKVGDRWTAATSTIQELTDFQQVDEGAIVCRWVENTMVDGRKMARIAFNGTVLGVGEDGKSKHQLDGYLYFDLEGRFISYLSLRGDQRMLDKDSKEVGRIEGQFVITRRPIQPPAGLSDQDVRSLTLEPNDQNTLLLHQDDGLGIRFLYPRRWRVAGTRGQQLGLDERGGSGVLLTVEPLSKSPTGSQFFKESQDWLQKQQLAITRVEPVRTVQHSPTHIEQFAFDVKRVGESFRMFYMVVRDRTGGVVAAARLLPTDLANVQREVEAIVRSIRLIDKQP